MLKFKRRDATGVRYRSEDMKVRQQARAGAQEHNLGRKHPIERIGAVDIAKRLRYHARKEFFERLYYERTYGKSIEGIFWKSILEERMPSLFKQSLCLRAIFLTVTNRERAEVKETYPGTPQVPQTCLQHLPTIKEHELSLRQLRHDRLDIPPVIGRQDARCPAQPEQGNARVVEGDPELGECRFEKEKETKKMRAFCSGRRGRYKHRAPPPRPYEPRTG